MVTLTAIDNFIKKAKTLNRASFENTETAVQIIADAESIIQEFVDKAFKMQDLLADMFFFQAGFELPLEEVKDEPAEKKDADQQITDYTFSIGPVNLYSISSVFADTIKKFQAQTADVASIYSPVSESWQTSIAVPVYGHEDEITGYTQEEIISYFDDRFYSDLRDSAVVLKELETAGKRITGISIENKNPMEITAKMAERIDLPAVDEEAGHGSSIHNTLEEFSNIINAVSGTIEQTGVSFESEITRIQKMAEIYSLKDIMTDSHFEHIQGFNASKEEQRIDEISSMKNLQLYSDYIQAASSISSTMQEAQKIAELSFLKELSIDAISQADKSSTMISHEQNMVDIPPFLPDIKGISVQTGKLNEVVAEEPLSMTTSHSLTLSRALKTISDYVHTGSEINSRVTEYLEKGTEGIGGLFSGSSPIDLAFEGNNPVIDMVQGIAESAGGSEMNLAYNISSALYGEGMSSVQDLVQAVPSVTALPASFSSVSPHSIGNAMQVLYGGQKEMQGGSAKSDVRFQNTFNIVVNMKGKGEETELRDLGKKIGHILSEEMRRYGGIR